MKHFLKRLLPALLALAMLGGCSKIPDKPQPETSETGESAETSEGSEKPETYVELDPVIYRISKEDVLTKLNAEGGVYEGIVRSEGEFDGSGYILLEEGQSLIHIAEIPTSQHYRLIIAAHSYGGASVNISAPEGSVGMYYIPSEETMGFEHYVIDNLYLSQGPAMLTLEAVKGAVSIDYILVENSTAVSDTCYRTAVSVVGRNTGIHTISTMKFLSDSYGRRILTAQNVTPGTNAEIDAVYSQTGRYPAMRIGDLMYSSPYADEDYAETAEEEIDLALEWGRQGGIISMGWHWFSPEEYGSDYYASGTMFDLDSAVTDRHIETASIEEIEGMYNSGMISESCWLIIKDIDSMAAVLERFKKEQLTVVWQPIPDGDTDLYWWGGDPESYKWLWNLMFRRMDEYHGLNNLIWVWNGTDPDYYPGDEVFDIIGQGMYNNSSASYAARFAALAHISDTDTKAVAVTGCDKLPDPNYLNRDNAMWLWLAPAAGSVTVNTDGTYSEGYNSWQRLNDVYNARLCVTRDELPDMSVYGIEYMDDEEANAASEAE